MNLKIFDRMESEVRGYIRSFPTLFDKARGSTLIDEANNSYIDFFAGAGTLNYGHNNPVIKQDLMNYLEADGVIHGLDMATVAKKEMLEALDRIILKPRGMNYKLQFPGPTGTNAVEAALKLARLVKGRSNIVSFTHGFHGVTGGSLAATANSKYRDAAGTSLDNTTFMPYDGYLGEGVDTTEYLERMIADRSSGMDHPAAVIVETVQGEGGVNVASAAWLRALEQVCRRQDMLLIVDDIQMGCGRTGRFFSFEESGISPDIVTLSKSISAFGLPMALVLMKPELDVWTPGAHNGTFRGNNLAFVTARAALLHYWSDDAFQETVRRKGIIMRNWLEHIAADYPSGEFGVRGRGMIQGLAAADETLADRIARRCFEKGLVIETSGADDVLKLMPALTIDEKLLCQGLDIIEDSVADVLGVPRLQGRDRKIKYINFRAAR
ncbi:MAG: diaminobutyrate--2-oxoglutarate transaminase [Betaproteobacteria bacterium]|nr:MAG: diaminobutyrate--2-oxoglutarate transaminase [Betaproteobacteria bacterium]